MKGVLKGHTTALGVFFNTSKLARAYYDVKEDIQAFELSAKFDI
jgi:hypothetical protein